MATRHVTASTYDPNALVRCVDAGRDAAVCGPADAGRGLPTTTGSYGLQSYTASLGIAVDLFGP
jgi:hypothetical protein